MKKETNAMIRMKPYKAKKTQTTEDARIKQDLGRNVYLGTQKNQFIVMINLPSIKLMVNITTAEIQT